MKRYLRFYGTAVLLVLLTVLSIAGATQAANPGEPGQPPNPAGRLPPSSPLTHGRLSQLNWQTVSGNTVTFHATAGIRRSFYNPPPNVGDSIAFANIVYGDGFQSPNTNFTVT